jgi:hypothetical protein
VNTSAPDPRIDRLYNLLPAIYRVRDAERKQALQALLRVIAEQVNVVEDDIQQLYDDWFIETAEDWAVPYIADLIGYRPVSDAGQVGDVTTAEGRALNRVLIPRRELANTIAYRRRKGTLALLELLANDVAGWPARAVEFFKLLGWNQNINHLHLERAMTADLRRVEALDLIGGPFDLLAHTIDVRRINSHRTVGRYNIPSVGLLTWRLRSYSVSRTRAYCVESVGPHCYTFSVLGNDGPLFIQPQPEMEPTHIAEELNVPAPIRRRALEQRIIRGEQLDHTEASGAYYGKAKSLAIWAPDWPQQDAPQPVPKESIVPADLTDWQYTPPLNRIAVDPVLGRFAFAADSERLPTSGIRVSYHYGFSADIGGGEYARPIFDPFPRANSNGSKLYRVGEDQELPHLRDALNRWREELPLDAVIEITDSHVYVEPIDIYLPDDHTLQLRAANGVRPVIRILDWETDAPDALTVTMCRGSRFTLDGLLVTGRGMRVHAAEEAVPSKPAEATAGPTAYETSSRAPICGSELVIRHCTLVPGWALECDCKPAYETEPSLELFDLRAKVQIEHSIIGAIQIHEDEVRDEPIPVRITDSIVDATSPKREAIGAPGYAHAHAIVTMQRCTVFGIVEVHAVELAENCIFTNCLNVARRQFGCMRFCYVPYGCRTPRRYHCQPDLVCQPIAELFAQNAITQDERDRALARERTRVAPRFNSERYGTPTYAQLTDTCAEEIRRGADDESEMGVFHDLFQPQREANLLARLDEYTPAGMDAGVIHVT